MFEELKKLEGNWFGKLEDILEELEELGLDPECCCYYVCREYITVCFEEDNEDLEVIIRLGGTERTITIDSVELL